MMISAVLGTLGAGDCERLVDGALIQPVNAWSSLAYSIVGVGLVVSVVSSGTGERAARVTFGLLLTATGIGSFLYHGPQSWGAGFFHDITFLSSLWFLAVANVGRARRWSGRTVSSSFVAIVAALTLTLLAAPTSTNLLTGVAVAALVASDLLMRRTNTVDARLSAIAIGLLAASLVANLIGRTGGPACTPQSLIQFHAVWHVLSALAIGTYFLATSDTRSKEAGR